MIACPPKWGKAPDHFESNGLSRQTQLFTRHGLRLALALIGATHAGRGAIRTGRKQIVTCWWRLWWWRGLRGAAIAVEQRTGIGTDVHN